MAFISARGGSVPLLAAEGEVERPGSQSQQRWQTDWWEFADLVLRLADEVFRLPPGRVALLFERRASEDCSHVPSESSWPLLFSTQLYSQMGSDRAFWLGKFCHALAHRSAGQGHSAHHALVAQALLSQHLPRFHREFRSSR